jgi:acetolactate synthase-1/2/3 large subunit
MGARFDDRVTGKFDEFARSARRGARSSNKVPDHLPAKRGKEWRGEWTFDSGDGDFSEEEVDPSDGLGIIHFEIAAKNVNKVVPADHVVLGDVGESLSQLIPLVEASSTLEEEKDSRTPWLNQIAEWKRDFPFAVHERSGTDELVRPQEVIAELHAQLAPRSSDVVVTTGVGQHQMWAAQFFRWRHPRSFISSGGSGTMGFGLPAAIGAKVALGSEKIVVDIDGDASFSMTCQELLTAAQYNIGVKVSFSVFTSSYVFLSCMFSWEGMTTAPRILC